MTFSNRAFPALRRGAAGFRSVAVAGLLVLAANSCSKKVTSVDAGYATLEGVPSSSAARLFVEQNYPMKVYFMRDEGSRGPSSGDVVIDSSTTQIGAPTVFTGVILDKTNANGYRPYRTESNGGMLGLGNFILQPVRRWLDGQAEFFIFTEDDTLGGLPRRYQARGSFNGVTTPASPLTNTATLVTPSSAYPTDLLLQIDHGNVNAVPPTAYTDTLIRLKWRAVPGAAGYFVHVFQGADGMSDAQVFQRGRPNVIVTDPSKDIYLAYVDGAQTSHKIGDPALAVYTQRKTFLGQTYQARVSAVDANGQLIGVTINDVSAPYDGTGHRFAGLEFFNYYLDWESDRYTELTGETNPRPDADYWISVRGAVEVAPSIQPPSTARQSRNAP
jgi:hypothetical protein